MADVDVSAVTVNSGRNRFCEFSIRDVGRHLGDDGANYRVVNAQEKPRSIAQLTELVGRVPLTCPPRPRRWPRACRDARSGDDPCPDNHWSTRRQPAGCRAWNFSAYAETRPQAAPARSQLGLIKKGRGKPRL